MVRLKIIGLAGLNVETDHDGLWFVDYIPDVGEKGVGELYTSADPKMAKLFPTTMDAMETWKQQSKTHPLRDDMKPNRPLTAFTVLVETVPDE